MNALRIGSLFSGIGGLEKGIATALEATVKWQVESDAYCRSVLARCWPNVRRFGDVRDVGASMLGTVDILCGGPPCQDLSDASHGAGDGLEGDRSGLWFELLRLVGELQPRWVVGENVDGAAWRRWVPLVRRELNGLGYASVPLRLRAFDLGAPFKGSRVFVVATPYREGKPAFPINAQVALMQATARARREDWGRPSPEALGVADGFPRGLAGQQRRAFGNAVMPAMGEAMGEWINIQVHAHRGTDGAVSR